MKTIDSHVTLEVLDELVKLAYPKEKGNSDNIRHFMNLLAFIESHSNVFFNGNNIKPEDISENAVARKLLFEHEHSNDERNIEFIDANDFDNKSIYEISKSEFKYFFLKDINKEIYQKIINSGYPIVNIKSLYEVKKMAASKSFSITNIENENKLNNWDQISDKILPFNSLVICDNYIFSNYTINLDVNFFPFLNVLLEFASIELPLEILILTSEILKDQEQIKEYKKLHVFKKKEELSISNLKNVYDKIYDFVLNKLGPQREFSLSIRFVKTFEQHDRNIFTNSQCFESGHSFNYFENKGLDKVKFNSSTKFSIIPYPTLNENKTYLDIDYFYLRSIMKIISTNIDKHTIGSDPLDYRFWQHFEIEKKINVLLEKFNSRF